MTAPAVVVGLGVTGRAVTGALTSRGHEVVVVEDRPTDATSAEAAALGAELVAGPEADRIDAVVRGADMVLPSPGVPDRHPVFAAARTHQVPVRSEFDLAARWDDRPILAVTGTNGKTTVTMWLVEVLVAAGVPVAHAGNTEVPLVSAIDDPAPEVFVVEASSFRLGHTERWRPVVGTWLNFAPDHLDVHADLAAYEAAKARIWRDRSPRAAAVANAEDPTVMAHAPEDAVTFGTGGEYDIRNGMLVANETDLVGLDELWSPLPHAASNGLAVAASACAHGIEVEPIRAGLRAFTGLRHRVELVAEADGVRWYDDSKATTPHATVAALGGFESVVLIAGGQNKGLDLSGILGRRGNIRGVVAIGAAAAEITAAVPEPVPRVVARSMQDAVTQAGAMARPGDTVLLSPGCASFDWYGSYAERGDDFARLATTIIAGIEPDHHAPEGASQ